MSTIVRTTLAFVLSSVTLVSFSFPTQAGASSNIPSAHPAGGGTSFEALGLCEDAAIERVLAGFRAQGWTLSPDASSSLMTSSTDDESFSVDLIGEQDAEYIDGVYNDEACASSSASSSVSAESSAAERSDIYWLMCGYNQPAVVIWESGSGLATTTFYYVSLYGTSMPPQSKSGACARLKKCLWLARADPPGHVYVQHAVVRNWIYARAELGWCE